MEALGELWVWVWVWVWVWLGCPEHAYRARGKQSDDGDGDVVVDSASDGDLDQLLCRHLRILIRPCRVR